MPPGLMVKCMKDPELNRNCMRVGMGIAEKLDLGKDQVISFYVGLKSQAIKIIMQPGLSPANACALHPELMKDMELEAGRSYGIRRDQNCLHIGPLIGIMANLTTDHNRPFGNQSFFISQLIQQGQKMGAICFAFNPRDVNLDKEFIQGYTYSNKTWKKANYRLPDVIYVRQPGYSISSNNLRKSLIKKGCRFVNPANLGKWETHRILSQHPDLQTYLPETRLVSGFKPVEAMLKKYRAVYLKPIASSQGKGIIRVSRGRHSNVYVYQYQSNAGPVKGTAFSLAELERSLKKIMGKASYLVQQEISLLRIQGSIADLRVMVQKNARGKWEVSGKAFRIGQAGAITSNISSGGSAGRIQELLANSFDDPHEITRIIREVDFLAVEAALCIEEHHSPIGELGIDIGVDQNGRIWFIEANLRPARKVFSMIGDLETRLLTVQRPIQYACYLAGF